MPTSGKKLIKELKQAGFTVDRISGSHYLMRKDGITVTVPNHTNDLPIGTEMAIRKLTGVKRK